MASVHDLKDPVFHTIPIGVVVSLSHAECGAVTAGSTVLAQGVPQPYATVIQLSNLAFGMLDKGNGLDIHVILAPIQLVLPYPR